MSQTMDVLPIVISIISLSISFVHLFIEKIEKKWKIAYTIADAKICTKKDFYELSCLIVYQNHGNNQDTTISHCFIQIDCKEIEATVDVSATEFTNRNNLENDIIMVNHENSKEWIEPFLLKNKESKTVIIRYQLPLRFEKKLSEFILRLNTEFVKQNGKKYSDKCNVGNLMMSNNNVPIISVNHYQHVLSKSCRYVKSFNT